MIDIVKTNDLKCLKIMYNNDRELLYKYDVQTPNFKFKSGATFSFIAIENSWETHGKYVLRDYKPCIEFWTKRCTNPKSIISQLSTALRTRQVVLHNIADLTMEQVQQIINANIESITFLNSYIGEQTLIRLINRM